MDVSSLFSLQLIKGTSLLFSGVNAMCSSGVDLVTSQSGTRVMRVPQWRESTSTERLPPGLPLRAHNEQRLLGRGVLATAQNTTAYMP